MSHKEEEGPRSKRKGTEGRGRAKQEGKWKLRKIKGEEGRERANHADNCKLRKRKGKQWR